MRSFDAIVMENVMLEPIETSKGITFEWVVCIVFTITVSPEWIEHGNLNATSVVVKTGSLRTRSAALASSTAAENSYLNSYPDRRIAINSYQ